MRCRGVSVKNVERNCSQCGLGIEQRLLSHVCVLRRTHTNRVIARGLRLDANPFERLCCDTKICTWNIQGFTDVKLQKIQILPLRFWDFFKLRQFLYFIFLIYFPLPTKHLIYKAKCRPKINFPLWKMIFLIGPFEAIRQNGMPQKVLNKY